MSGSDDNDNDDSSYTPKKELKEAEAHGFRKRSYRDEPPSDEVVDFEEEEKEEEEEESESSEHKEQAFAIDYDEEGKAIVDNVIDLNEYVEKDGDLGMTEAERMFMEHFVSVLREDGYEVAIQLQWPWNKFGIFVKEIYDSLGNLGKGRVKAQVVFDQIKYAAINGLWTKAGEGKIGMDLFKAYKDPRCDLCWLPRPSTHRITVRCSKNSHKKRSFSVGSSCIQLGQAIIEYFNVIRLLSDPADDKISTDSAFTAMNNAVTYFHWAHANKADNV